MSTCQVRADNIGARRGDRLIFSRLSFDLAGGQSLIFAGANGAGKSTALRALLGLIPLEAGTVAFSGAETGLLLANASHYLGHRDAMKRELTVRENLSFWQSLMGGFAGQTGMAIEAAVAEVGLAHALDLPFGYLSAGQKRRTAFARLLVAHRPVWLLDEPTASFDSQAKSAFEALANRHLKSGGIVIAATHEPLDLVNCRELRFSGPVDMVADPFLPEES